MWMDCSPNSLINGNVDEESIVGCRDTIMLKRERWEEDKALLNTFWVGGVECFIVESLLSFLHLPSRSSIPLIYKSLSFSLFEL